VRLLSATVVIGALSGALIGGVGGRLAMRLLFLTTGDAVKGVQSDDGFEIGRFTAADTLGLLLVTTALGVIAAIVYLVARPFVAPLGRNAIPAMAALYGVLGGAMLVHRGGVDFTRLKPVLLAIALFLAIFAGFGATVAHFVNRAAATGSGLAARSWWLLAPPLAITLVPPIVVGALVAIGLNQVDATANRDDRVWRAVHTTALVVMTGLFVFGAVDLARDALALT
jgi:hypothetical protein